MMWTLERRAGVLRSLKPAGAIFSIFLLGGCLFTEPIAPPNDRENTPPTFNFVNPSNESTFDMQLTSTPIEFSVLGADVETDREDLYYVWRLDTLEKLFGYDQRRYQTSGQELGAGTHELQVTVIDEADDVATIAWTIQVQ